MAVDAADGDTFILTTGTLQVKGWAADPDPSPGGGALTAPAQVEIFVDGVSAGTATLGEARPDIRNAYNRSDFLNSGWTFSSTIVSLGLAAGPHVVTAVAEDSTGRQAQLSSPRTFVVTDSPPSGNKAPLGHIDSAVDEADGDTILLPPANLVVQGWAADPEDGALTAPAQVEVFIDGALQGTATLGSSRPDIRDAFNRPNFINSGWSLTVGVSSIGVHTVTAVATDTSAAAAALGGARTFRVGNPAPTLASLSPSIHTESSPGFTLTVKGANFVSNSTVEWNSSPRTTAFVSSTELTATIPDTDIASNGTAQVTVVNPTPGGGTSNALTFTILADMAPVVDVELNLFKVDNGGQVPDGSEESTGASLSINDDDDDFNGQDDNDNPTLDGEQDRRDMAKLVLNVKPWDGLSAPVEFTADGPSGVRVFNEADQEVTLPETIVASRFSSGAISYYVEGRTQSTVIFTLTYDPSGSQQSDAVKVIIGEPTTIKLSFDDGPVSVEPLSQNFTQRVMDTLLENRVADGAPASFFVQTHVSYRGGDSVGQAIITAESTAGHHVEVHTGSDEDHALHTDRVVLPPYDANGDNIVDSADGQNALESDLIRAKARIFDLTGRTPDRVRPPQGETDLDVLATYARVGLTNTLWDVDSADSTFCSAPNQLACLQNVVRTTIQAGMDTNQQDFVVLMHDIKPVTTDNLADILKTIEDAIQHRGRNVRFELLPTP